MNVFNKRGIFEANCQSLFCNNKKFPQILYIETKPYVIFFCFLTKHAMLLCHDVTMPQCHYAIMSLCPGLQPACVGVLLQNPGTKSCWLTWNIGKWNLQIRALFTFNHEIIGKLKSCWLLVPFFETKDWKKQKIAD